MSTRSFIAMELGNDEGYRAVYCHSDGYPSWNGRVLHQHYTDPTKLAALLDLGHLSCLGTGLGKKHNFRDRYDAAVTTAYGRDRGDKDCEAEHCHGLNQLLETAANYGAAYLYVFSMGLWTFTAISSHGWANYPLTLLSEELERIGVIEHVG